MNLHTSLSQGRSLVGAVRRFGPHGVLYEVVEVLDDQNALVRVIETGEETTYSLARISADPAS